MNNVANTNQNKVLLGIDTGGTFTDFVVLDSKDPQQNLRIHKLLSTPSAPEQAILQGIKELGLMDLALKGQLLITHGSTVATNAALEGKGVRTVLISNRGFKDILTIGRQTRRELYNLQPPLVAPPVPPELCLETGGRLGADGSVIDDLSPSDLKQLIQQIEELKPEAVAINLLFSFLDERFEKAIEQAIPDNIFVSRSSFVLPEYKEYERGIATWLNAWLGPLVERYLAQLSQSLAPSPVAVMQSSGGTIDALQAGARAVNMLLSGPAGGLAAARYISDITDSERLLTFDMGGTSTDVALLDGEIQLTNEGHIGHYPVAVPMVDMHTIGAGGGSIATIDAGGLLHVGPQSAGANPGPACYGKGGTQPTVTDANLVLGRLKADNFLGGAMALSLEKARQAIETIATPLTLSIEEAALGIIQIANEHMVHALRVISVQRGFDPGAFTLCSFGGAGGLHVCALAKTLHMKHALVPVHSGVLSAMGMLVAPKERQLSRTCNGLLSQLSDQYVSKIINQLNLDGREQLLNEGVEDSLIKAQPSLDLRYQGQSYTLNIAWSNNTQAIAHFNQRHKQRFGHELDLPVELVNVRLALRAHTQQVHLPTIEPKPIAQAITSLSLYGVKQAVALYQRKDLAPGQTVKGPALIIEQVSTTFVAQGWQACCDQWGNLLLEY
ncbi:MAG: hydantoinase/oxoprolinase family protein [Spongiibacteraceae bacterium]|nr:hydantoinase/oxoprolinase family protein [Spongiibacteraceae bacterium]